MKRMLCLRTKTHVVFFDCRDRKQARAFREAHPEFKGTRILDIIQAYPEQITYGKIIER